MDATNELTLSQYLTFHLDVELFAVDIATVREIINETNITKIPQMPDYLRGVISIRGNAVPVVDLRLKFGMPRTEFGTDTCVIITEVLIAGSRSVVGILADSVQEVLEIKSEDIKPTPTLGMAIDTRFIKGMSRQDDKFIIILDTDTIFLSSDAEVLSDALAPNQEVTTT